MPSLALVTALQHRLNATRRVDWLSPLLLRFYLAPVFWMAGWNKLMAFESTVEWFGDKDWGLGLPFPVVMAGLATASELGGAVLLALGLGVRWVSLPLMATMLVAISTVHWHNGWLAIAEGMGPFASERTAAAVERLAAAKQILMQHGNYEWLTEHGSLAILNNGIEFAVTYFVMLLVLFFSGAGRYVSLDYWIGERLACRRVASTAEYAA